MVLGAGVEGRVKREKGGENWLENRASQKIGARRPEGCLAPGWWGGWQWTRDGEKVASISLRAEDDRLRLSYRARIAGGEWHYCSRPIFKSPYCEEHHRLCHIPRGGPLQLGVV